MPDRPLTCLVTGASRGIGEGIARSLAARGHRVAVAARSADRIEALALDTGGVPVVLDVTDGAAVDAAVASVAEALGPIDVLVNNAGVADSSPFAKTSDAIWDRTVAVNLTGPFRLARACVPAMVERGFGRIIFVASNAGLTGYRYTAAYCASKHGVIGLMRGMAAELAASGVTVNAICPGFVDTPMASEAVARIEAMTGRSAADSRRALEKLNPQKRLVEIDEVVHLVETLLPDRARGINGQTLVVDGGQVMH